MRVASTDGSAISDAFDVDGLAGRACALGELFAGFSGRICGASCGVRHVATDLARLRRSFRALVARLRFGLLRILLHAARGVVARRCDTKDGDRSAGRE